MDNEQGIILKPINKLFALNCYSIKNHTLNQVKLVRSILRIQVSFNGIPSLPSMPLDTDNNINEIIQLLITHS